MSENFKSNIITIFKGCFLSVIATLIFILLFALLISITNLSVGVIKPVNQFIKVISLFLGGITFIKGEKGFLKGIALGLIYAVTVYLIFALIENGKVFGIGFFYDLLFCTAVGCLCGIIAVNLKRTK